MLDYFRLPQFGAYEYQFYEKSQDEFLELSNKIAHGGHNTPVFKEMS